jgi:hypothetical protein
MKFALASHLILVVRLRYHSLNKSQLSPVMFILKISLNSPTSNAFFRIRQSNIQWNMSFSCFNIKLKKTSDELDLTVEHLLYGGESVIYILTKIVNMVFSNTAIPDSLKGGIGL